MRKNNVFNILITIPLFALILLISGCVSSNYKELSGSDISDPSSFINDRICISGEIKNGSFGEILLNNTGGEYRGSTYARACGTLYKNETYILYVDSFEPLLKLTTDKKIYHSNESMTVELLVYSQKETNANIHIYGVQNRFGRSMLEENRNIDLVKGENRAVFNFKTPSCEQCSALEPGSYYMNASVTIAKVTMNVSTSIDLERENNE